MMVIVIGSIVGGLGGEVPIMIWAAGRKKAWSEWLPAVAICGCLGCLCLDAGWWAVYRLWNPSFLRGITPSLAMLVLAAVPATVAFQYVAALLAGLEEFGKRAAITLVAQLVELAAVAVLLGAVSRTADMAIVGNLLGLVAATIIACLIVGRGSAESERRSSAGENFRSALSLGIRGQAGNIAMFFNYRLDVFVLNYFLNPAQVGLYALGVVVSESLWQIPSAAALVLFPRTARTLDQDASQFTCFVSRQVLLLAGILGIAVALASPVLIPWIFGARFAPSIAVVWWILPGTVALAVGKVMAADITARGKPEYNSIISVGAGVLTLSLDFVLIPRMGIQGAALASSIAYLTQSVLIATTLRHVLGVKWRAFFIPPRGEFENYRSAWREFRSKIVRSGIIDVISTNE